MSFIARRWQAFIEARSPRRDALTLTQRNLYIVPSKGGWGYTVVVLVLLLAAINEQLNLGYALAFCWGRWTVGHVPQPRQPAGLRLSLGPLGGVHAGQTLSIPVLLDATTHPQGCWGMTLDAPGQPPPWPRWQRVISKPFTCNWRALPEAGSTCHACRS